MQPQKSGGGSAQTRIVIILAALIFAGILPFIFFIETGDSDTGSSSNGDGGFVAFMLFFGGIVILVVGGIAVYKFMETYYVTKPEVTFSPPQAKLGETMTMSYQQSFKRMTQVNKLSFKLIFRETAKYQVGTDTRTVTHELVVDEFGYSGQTYPKGHMLNDAWQFRIPENGMHTFHSSHNWLRWYVKVNVEIEGWVDFVREYEVVVLPERVMSS